MRVLFVHDGPIGRRGKDNHYGLYFGDSLLIRYRYLGSTLSLMMRVMDLSEEESSKYDLLTRYDEMIEVPDFKSITRYFSQRSKAKRIVRAAVEQHDIIVCRLPSAIGKMAAEYSQKLKKPLLSEFVSCTFDAYWNYNFLGKLIAPYKLFEQKRLVKDLPYISYVTEEFLQCRYPSNAKQISCSNVEIHVKRETPNEKILRYNTWKEGERLNIATVAALNVPYKGQADVIRAMSKIKKRGELKLHYYMVGQGSDERLRDLCEKLGVRDYVTILGPMEHDSVLTFLEEQVDVYIQPSKQEGLPRALIEAMSRGCACLGARTAGIPELLEEPYIFQPGNIQEIMQRLQGWTSYSLQTQSQRNFQFSKKYDFRVLQQARHRFYDEFLLSIKELNE